MACKIYSTRTQMRMRCLTFRNPPKQSPPTSRADANDNYHIQRALQFALETAEFGRKTTWKNSATGNSGYVIPTKVSPSPTGDFFKEYVRTILSNGWATTHTGGGCRLPEGSWQVGPDTLVSSVATATQSPAVAVAPTPAPVPAVDATVAGSTPSVSSPQDREIVLFVQRQLNTLGYNSGRRTA